MADVNITETIDLSKYGMDGTIEMCVPSMRKSYMLRKSLASKYKKGPTGELETDPENLEDIGMMYILVYIKSAPFEPTIESFLDYCDKMDDKQIGSAEKLYEEMKAVAQRLSGDDSPLSG